MIGVNYEGGTRSLVYSSDILHVLWSSPGCARRSGLKTPEPTKTAKHSRGALSAKITLSPPRLPAVTPRSWRL